MCFVFCVLCFVFCVLCFLVSGGRRVISGRAGMYVVQLESWIDKLAKALLCFVVCLAPVAYVSAEMKQAVTASGQAKLQMADSSNYRVELLIDVEAVLYDNDKHKAGEGEYVSLFQILPSNAAHPTGLCGAGSEVWLYVYQVKSADLVEKTKVLVSSCLRSISMESQNSGAQQQDLDFSSVRWTSEGFSIQWFSYVGADGRSLQRSNFVLHEGAFLRQDELSQERPNTKSLQREMK